MSSKKRVRPGRIEPSGDGSAIVVHFTTEITHHDDDGMPTKVEKVPDKREIEVAQDLRGMGVEKINNLAQEIVQRCKYIPASKIHDVEQVLTAIHAAQFQRAPVGDVGARKGRHRHRSEGAPRSRRRGTAAGQEEGAMSADCEYPRRRRHSARAPSPVATEQPVDFLPEASMACVDDYVEALYEDKMELKAKGAMRLLRLCAEVRPLEELSEHSTLLGVLSRELRENAKRSHDLAVAIIGIFLCMAYFSKFHLSLMRHECLDAAMKVVEYESRRGKALRTELEHSCEKTDGRFRQVFGRQDRLLQLCLLALRCLAESPGVERKLVGQRICSLLIPTLHRSSQDLLVIALGFIHKLVIFEANKDQFVQNADALAKLAELTGHPSSEVAHMALRVCYNLSFDDHARSTFGTQTGLIGRLRPAIQHGPTRKIALRLLYQLSIDAPLRGVIANKHPECIGLAVQLLDRTPEKQRKDVEAVALCVNLASDAACSALLVETETFPRMALRAIRDEDPLLLKVVRFMCCHDRVRPRLLSVMEATQDGSKWLHEAVQLAISSFDRQHVLVEVLGALAALDCSGDEVPWADLCEHGLLDLLHRLLIVGFSEDDVLLEAVMIVGTLARDSACVSQLALSKVPAVLPSLFSEKGADSEIMVQVLFAIRCLLIQEETREVVLNETDTPELILELLGGYEGQLDSATEAVQAEANEVLDIILAVDGQNGFESQWASRIKAFRFEAHNEEWCQRLRRGGFEDTHSVGSYSNRGSAQGSKGESRSSFAHWTDVGGLSERKWDTRALRQ
eukprot:TRINITY_DN14558_c0_g1_i2.p1 TRINITY_DN14558_c0_g1~~TRINITY_DN14558_c0_g1_i2.p1  ORF type:complete len:793 (+),score=148.37 TRINITY_DN14558_c0_g1_i2:153-2531(+)